MIKFDRVDELEEICDLDLLHAFAEKGFEQMTHDGYREYKRLEKEILRRMGDTKYEGKKLTN